MLTEELEGLSLDSSKYKNPIYQLAYKNSYSPFFEYFSKNIVNYLSNRDLIGTVEKDIKFLLLPIFFESNYYLPISELENSEGYTDVYLTQLAYRRPVCILYSAYCILLISIMGDYGFFSHFRVTLFKF
jgi:hypothetical protein